MAQINKGIGVKMEFSIGKVLIKIVGNWETVIVAPIGDHVAAVRVNMFEMPEHNSINVQAEIYHKDDTSVSKKVKMWLKSPYDDDEEE